MQDVSQEQRARKDEEAAQRLANLLNEDGSLAFPELSRECPDCEDGQLRQPILGVRSLDDDHWVKCPNCHGSGRIPKSPAEALDELIQDYVERNIEVCFEVCFGPSLDSGPLFLYCELAGHSSGRLWGYGEGPTPLTAIETAIQAAELQRIEDFLEMGE